MSEETDQYTRGYSLPIRLLHWLMAAIVISMIIAGIAMVNGPWGGEFPPARGMLYDYHRGMGFVLMVLVVVRLVTYRFTTPPSPLPASIGPTPQRIAHSVHFLLYVSLFLQPLFGWYATNLWGVKQIPVFGIFSLPPLAEKNRELGNQLLEIHGWLGIAITILVMVHILGVVYHQFVLKDAVLKRMLRARIES